MVSGFKKSKNSKKSSKMELAKDKKQLMLAVGVIILFVINGIVMFVRIYLEDHPITSNNNNSQSEIDKQYSESPDAPADAGNTTVPPTDTTASPTPATDTTQASGANNASDTANDIYVKTIAMNGNTQAPQTQPETNNNVEIMSVSQHKFNGKMVMVNVSSAGRSDPFANPSTLHSGSKARPIPKYLTPPPSLLTSSSEVGRVMTTTVSGILYDKYSPSAILNIEGADYLVKKGDIINSYKVLYIGKTQVIVQLGRNIYKAGVGQLLSLTDLNFNTIANLNRKFGGNSVSIKPKAKTKSRKHK